MRHPDRRAPAASRKGVRCQGSFNLAACPSNSRRSLRIEELKYTHRREVHAVVVYGRVKCASLTPMTVSELKAVPKQDQVGGAERRVCYEVSPVDPYNNLRQSTNISRPFL